MTAGRPAGYRPRIVATAQTRICVQQLEPRVADPAHNRALAREAITQAVAGGAKVVVLPELVNSGYVFTSAQEAASLAVAADDPLIDEWANAAVRHGIVLAAGFCERGADGQTYNSAVLLDPQGIRVVYRKLHLWDREKLWFTPGDALPPVVDTVVGRMSAVICYDLEFPELTRSVALEGAELLLVPTNWPLMARPGDERPGEVTNAMATARINHIPIACADRCGIERGQLWTGGSTIVDADGWAVGETPWRVGEPRRSGPLFADLDLARSRDKRLTELADAFADRRPDLYGAVARIAEPAVG